MSLIAAPASRSAEHLTIAPPPGEREKIVLDALAAVQKNHADDLTRAEQTIADFGLSIEAARLRDRLGRAARGDLQRLLLSTKGVPEALFLAAIKQQLTEASAPDAVVDVGGEVKEVAKALAEAIAALAKVAKTLEADTAQEHQSLDGQQDDEPKGVAK